MNALAMASPLLGVYRQPEPVLVSGCGARVTDADGREYLDFTSGIAVNALGHGDATVSEAIRTGLETGLVHTSNLFRTRPAEDLAAWLVERSFGDRVFFCNSGAEAVEGALKFARRWATSAGGPDRTGIVAFAGGFHGRTLGALSATDRPAYRAPFAPLVPRVEIVDPTDRAAVRRAIPPGRTAGVIVEPIQAEGGVREMAGGFLRTLRELCDDAGAALIFDEVQTGLGRTGRLWAHEWSGVTPDLMTLAKPLAGGLPMGAVVLAEHVADTIQPGDHASTFGGGPLVASVALAVCRRLGAAEILDNVGECDAWLRERFAGLARRGAIAEARGRGLLWGLQLESPAGTVVDAARARGLLVCTAGADVVRLLPPLNVSIGDLREGVEILEEVL
ncbi:MAG TPA: acetylornithine/succinylornithine family transaminase [Longimicrobiales bacterium]|nr:acetylornithine/succinylornithine family transaminase [Longimicrobiales bacterium]